LSRSKTRAKTRAKTRKTSRSKKRSTLGLPRIQLSRKQKIDILGIVLGGLGLFTLLSILSPEQGAVTGIWVDILRRVFGWGATMVPIALLAIGIGLLSRKLSDRSLSPDLDQIVGALVLYLGVLVIMHALVGGDDLDARLAISRQGRGGGVIGAVILSALISGVGSSGAVVVIPEMFELGLRAIRWVKAKLPVFGVRRRPKPTPTPTPIPIPASKTSPITPASKRAPRPQSEQPPISSAPAPSPTNWQMPSLVDILEPGVEGRADAAFDEERGKLIEDTLLSFGAPAKVVEINRGPTITQFGVEPDYVEGRGGKRTKVKISKISALADDLALALAASSIRVEAPVPGKGFVGVEVPNTEISLVSLRNVMESDGFNKIHSKLRLGLGEDVSGKAVAADLGTMPHLLIAGTTGSGKSVCVNSIIASLLLQNSPNELRIVMIDPKRVELTYYNGVPHLLAPVIVELDRVVGSLKWISREMDERYRRFAKESVRNIAEFNRRMRENKQVELPFLVVVIDELADLMMLAPDETERLITRMAQLARATGIHLVIATQRPSVDVVTGLIKANFPARIAFAVASSIDSRVILDQPGAERLLGQGDMLFQAPDAPAPVRMQGSFVSEPELARLIRYWKNAGATEDDRHIMATSPTATLPLNSTLEQVPLWEDFKEDEQQGDEIFPDAVATVRRMRRASISLLQRRLKIGYTRAARLIDQMEEEGIIGPPKGGSHPREVLDYGDLVEADGGE
jgi:S-DNA-T family DNA segregation ATPase FtsK/SpoIIIE